MTRNPLLAVDSYKASHFMQLPPGTKAMYHYIEARSAPTPDQAEVVYFGLQYILDEYLSKPITMADIIEADEVFKMHGEPFPREGFERVLTKWGGFMPVEIRAVPEGSIVPIKHVLSTVGTLDKKLPWLNGYLETLLLRQWYPISVATRSYHAKKLIRGAMLRTSDSLAGLEFKLHDFGARGVSSGESAMIGGMAHLVNFAGTDTVEALVGARRYYNMPMAGFSIPASEHSTITSWGKHREEEAYRNILTQFGKPGAIFACVSDSYDINNAVSNLWGGSLRQEVIDSGATLVVRPDSGDPVVTVLSVVQQLDNTFGSTLNSKGFKVLKNVRVIQGDGLDNPAVIDAILRVLEANGFSADNIAFGMGGGLLQKVNRDTYGFAMKCSAVYVDGVWQDVFKEAPGKESKRGLITLAQDEEGNYFNQDKRNAGVAWADRQVDSLSLAYHPYQRAFISRRSLTEIRNRTGLWA